MLSNAQVAVLLQASAGVATNRDEELNDIYRKTQQYVNRFNTMNNPEKEHQEVVDELDNLQKYVGYLCIYVCLGRFRFVHLACAFVCFTFCPVNDIYDVVGMIPHRLPCFPNQCLTNIPRRN